MSSDAVGWQDYPDASDGVKHTVIGTVKRLSALHSPQLANRRDIFVHLPASYDQGDRRYPVLYMHDGQNLFDRAISFGEEWDVDGTMEAASREGLEVIVVGIPNTGERRVDEYSPFRDERRGAGGRGDRYLDFVIDTVKPRIDADFRTLPDRESTGMAGSSMGGLITLHAFFRQPHVFGLAAVMSPALWFADRAIFDTVEAAPFVPGRLYLDVGTREGVAELMHVARLRDRLLHKGYERGRDLSIVVEKGAGHDERAWGRRLGFAIRFLYGEARPRQSDTGIRSRGAAHTARPAGRPKRL